MVAERLAAGQHRSDAPQTKRRFFSQSRSADRVSGGRSAIRSEGVQRSMGPKAAYGVWEAQVFKLPERSRFYSLSPVGIGTPQVESLSGYIARLAEAHVLSVGDMVGRRSMSASEHHGLQTNDLLHRARLPKRTAFSCDSIRRSTECRHEHGNGRRILEGLTSLLPSGCSYPVAVARHLVRYVFVQTAESLVPTVL